MLDDALKVKMQIEHYLQYQKIIPCFTDSDWKHLEQIHRILYRFNELTLFVSKQTPRINMTVPLYYELHDLLEQGGSRKGELNDLDNNIAEAIRKGLLKYKKYYDLMDKYDIYYTSMILDPRLKGDLLLSELADQETGQMIIDAIRKSISERYYTEPSSSQPDHQERSSAISDDSTELRLFRRLPAISKRPQQSDIEDYFASVIWSDTERLVRRILFVPQAGNNAPSMYKWSRDATQQVDSGARRTY